jgi:predicted Zn-dependent protease
VLQQRLMTQERIRQCTFSARLDCHYLLSVPESIDARTLLVVALQRSLLPARAALGKALLQAGRPREAIAHLESAVPADPALWLALSKAYRAAGRDEDAARAAGEYRTRMSVESR